MTLASYRVTTLEEMLTLPKNLPIGTEVEVIDIDTIFKKDYHYNWIPIEPLTDESKIIWENLQAEYSFIIEADIDAMMLNDGGSYLQSPLPAAEGVGF